MARARSDTTLSRRASDEARRRRGWLIAALGLALTARGAGAYETGITGYSGKTRGIICNACHSGGTAPQVNFAGPAQVPAGPVATFVFVVQSQAPAQQTAAGFDVAASGGQLAVVADEDEQQPPGTNELTHLAPKANDANGVAMWQIAWQAPAAPGTYTLFGAGNSVNDDLSNFGDRASATTFAVVVDAAATPTPTATPPPNDTPAVCVGDCDSSGAVTVDELAIGARIVLGTAAVAECPTLGCGADGQVTIDCLVEAVDRALSGCPQSSGDTAAAARVTTTHTNQNP